MGDIVAVTSAPKETSTSTLQCPMLTTTNYTVWAMKMTVMLRVDKVWETVETEEADVDKVDLAKALLFQSIPETLTLQVVGRLKTYEERIRDEEDQEDDQTKLMYASNYQEGYDQGRSRGARGGRFTGRSRGRGRGNYQNRGKSLIVCYRCDKHGHYAFNCPYRLLKLQEIQDTTDSENQDTKDLLMHEVVFLNEKKVHPKKFETKVAGDDVWYLDNGASNHMTRNQSYFTKLDETVTDKVRFGDDLRVDIKGRGSILFVTKSGDQKILAQVYWIPDLKSNILSLGQAT
ncbi:PREDICTED: uncharacterized protein LOC104763167 [Camelina sativa]|uniref:Uncharacterized protein LOC104763167 n=1 Tax=Camelina sativa TaxID=90675 RepID=A0ABM0XET2_CAMSA|nr:PREDICTED: uncharacterized protein LOC104763167 [Camelina sativa]